MRYRDCLQSGSKKIKQFTGRHRDTLSLFGRCGNVSLEEVKRVGGTRYMLDTFRNVG